MKGRLGRRSALGATLVCVVSAGAAGASFPGANGPIVFDGVDATAHSVQIYRVATDGTGLTKLTNGGPAWNECPAWSASARLIFFDTALTSDPGRVYRMNGDGSDRRLSDDLAAPSHVCPSPGPGGNMVVAIQFNASGTSPVIRMRIDGSDRKVIGPASKRQANFEPWYRPTGKRIAYNRVTFTQSGRGVVRADIMISNGLKSTSITPQRNAQFFSPAWSPDGRTLVAVRGASQIVRMNAVGRDIRQLASVPGASISSPVFSPDGTEIAFDECRGDCGDPLDPAGRGSLWVMNADGSGLHEILDQSTAGVQPAGRLDWGRG
jgi:Tol biopolymer transport system component